MRKPFASKRPGKHGNVIWVRTNVLKCAPKATPTPLGQAQTCGLLGRAYLRAIARRNSKPLLLPKRMRPLRNLSSNDHADSLPAARTNNARTAPRVRPTLLTVNGRH